MLVGMIQFALLIIVVFVIVGTYGYFWRGATIQISMIKGMIFGVSSSYMDVEVQDEKEESSTIPVEVIQFSIICFIFTVLWRRE